MRMCTPARLKFYPARYLLIFVRTMWYTNWEYTVCYFLQSARKECGRQREQYAYHKLRFCCILHSAGNNTCDSRRAVFYIQKALCRRKKGGGADYYGGKHTSTRVEAVHLSALFRQRLSRPYKHGLQYVRHAHSFKPRNLFFKEQGFQAVPRLRRHDSRPAYDGGAALVHRSDDASMGRFPLLLLPRNVGCKFVPARRVGTV